MIKQEAALALGHLYLSQYKLMLEHIPIVDLKIEIFLYYIEKLRKLYFIYNFKNKRFCDLYTNYTI